MTLIVYGSRFARTPKPGQLGDALEVDDWKTVFETQHSTDAHAWAYTRYTDGRPDVQIRIPVDQGMPKTDGQVLFWFVFLDYDESNNHQELLELIESIPDEHPLAQYAALYPTKSGMRIVYRLSEPVVAEDFGPMVRGVAMELFRLTKLKVDATTDQWHRCFRLPSVTRSDGKADGPTWEQPYYFPPIITDWTVDPDDLPRSRDALPWKKGAALSLEDKAALPTDHDELSGIRKRFYKKALRGSRFTDYLFEDAVIQHGRRDQTLVAMASEVVATCFYKVPEASAQECFLLILPVTYSFDPDGEPWDQKLWRLVQHCWVGEEKKRKDREDRDAVERTTRESIIEKMLEKMPPGLVPNDPVDRELFAQRHFCLQTSAGAYVITETGDYSTTPLRIAQLPAYFNQPSMSCLDVNRFRTPQGKMLNGHDIVNSFSTVVDFARYQPSRELCSKLVIEGDRRIVEVSPFAIRSDLYESAELDQEVGEWLSKFHDHKTLELWLASALAIHRGPTAALFLKGPARAGKSMLAMGIAEAFGRRPVAGAQAFHDFNGALVDSPVILVDEGLPKRKSGMDTADLFRSLITGSGVSTQRKFQDSADSVTPYRIVMAANSYDMVTDLIGRRSLAGEDMEAFRERILVIEPGVGPTQYLDRRGNMAFTKDGPKGSWIGGACRLARHLIRLYQIHFEEQEFVRQGRRMLVEGQSHAAFTVQFDLSGHGREVVQALTDSITAHAEKRMMRQLTKCIEVEDSGVWVRKWPFATQNSTSNPTQFARALERFCLPSSRRSPIDMSTSFKVDIAKVMVCADALGLPTKALRELDMKVSGIA